ncbi:MAG: hypothetical protein ACFCVG_02500 [Kineosporiaceae bacterium]
MESLSSIIDRIERLLEERPDGVDASFLVSELTDQGISGDDAAAALAQGLGDHRWELDTGFRVTLASVQAPALAP